MYDQYVLILAHDRLPGMKSRILKTVEIFALPGAKTMFYYCGGGKYASKDYLDLVRENVENHILNTGKDTSTQIELFRFAEGHPEGFVCSHRKHAPQIEAILSQHPELSKLKPVYVQHDDWKLIDTAIAFMANILVRSGAGKAISLLNKFRAPETTV